MSSSSASPEEVDLRTLCWFSSPVGDLRRGFDMSVYRTDIPRDPEVVFE